MIYAVAGLSRISLIRALPGISNTERVKMRPSEQVSRSKSSDMTPLNTATSIAARKNRII